MATDNIPFHLPELSKKVIYIDQFGNLITNISETMLRRSFQSAEDRIVVSIKRRIIRGLSKSYSAKKPGELLAIVGSSGYLEVAANEGFAEKQLGSQRGDSVTLSLAKEIP